MESPLTGGPGLFFRSTRFGDHEELSSLIEGGDAEFIQRARGRFAGEFTHVGLEGGTAQFSQIELPYLARGTRVGERLMFVLHLRPQHDYVWKGQRLAPESILFFPPRSEHQDITPGNTYWAILSFDRAPLERTLTALNGTDSPLNSWGSQALVPLPESVEQLRQRLQALHGEVCCDPSLLAVPEARRGIGESVLSALGLAIGSASRARPQGYGAAARTRVARQVEAYLASHAGESLYLADLCSVAGVGERTLRYIFQERYGLSPVRYLKLRRLHQVRRALRRADPDLNTVQSVANRCGIWHLGRFASEYRSLFNESPLDTLKKTRLSREPGRGSQIGSRPGPRASSILGLG